MRPALGLLVAFAAISVMVAAGALVWFDRTLFGLGPSWASPVLLPFGAALSLLWLGSIGFCLALRGDSRAVICLLALFALGSGIELAMKAWLHQPAGEMPHQLPMLGLELANPYPSGHAFRATYLSLVVVLLLPSRPWWLMNLPLAVLIASNGSGAHHPIDLVAGALLGAAMALLWKQISWNDLSTGKSRAPLS